MEADSSKPDLLSPYHGTIACLRGSSVCGSHGAACAVHDASGAGVLLEPRPPSRMDFSALFDDSFLSDFQLALITADGADLGRFNVHGVVLAGQSPYFKARLQNWIGEGQRVLPLTVGEEEREAAELMLRCAYSGGGAADAATAQQLLSTMVLADRYQLRTVVDCCQSRIMSMDSAAISWPEALALLCLPPGLKESEAFRALTEARAGAWKALQRVWEDYRSLTEAWIDPGARARFLDLPCEAVQWLLSRDDLRVTTENCAYVAAASWALHLLRTHGACCAAGGDTGEASTSSGGACCGGCCGAASAYLASSREVQAAVAEVLRCVRYPHLTANFMYLAVARQDLFRALPEAHELLLEALQYRSARDTQRSVMQMEAPHRRFHSRNSEREVSAFTCYIRKVDLQQALAKYRASNGREAYYLLTQSHFYNGFSWRLKLTVKPPDPDSRHHMNVHVGLCWSIDIGSEPLPLPEQAAVAVEFAIATWDFTTNEEDPTRSDGDILIRSGTCWGWDDFFGPEVYGPDSDEAWQRYMNLQDELLLTCHLINCS